MTQKLTAVVDNGLLKPDSPVNLPDGTVVEIVVSPIEPASTPVKKKRSVQEILAEIAAIPVDDPNIEPDPHVARDHDHYLYGAPRRS